MIQAVLMLLTLLGWSVGLAQNPSASIRPIRDDVGFCWQIDQMQRLIEYLQKSIKKHPPQPTPLAAISPHDDYLYAGTVYYPLFNHIRTKEAVIIGLTHGSVRREIGDPQNVLIFEEFTQWSGLVHPLAISPLREIILQHLNDDFFIINNKAHQLEHSIEALVPWLQYFNPEITITPIMVTAMDGERMQRIAAALADIISKYVLDHNLQLGDDLMILISSDANHYGADFNNTPFGEDESAHTKGTAEDRRMAQAYLTGNITDEKIISLSREICSRDKAQPPKVLWCGRYAIPFGLLLANHIKMTLRAQSLTGRLLRYSDTYSEGVIPLKKSGMGLTAPFSLKHWVGFFSAEYY